MFNRKSLSLSVASCALGIVAISWAQEPVDLYSNLRQLFHQIENKEVVSVSISNAQIDSLMKQADPEQLLIFFEPCIANTNVAVRSQALGFALKVAELHPSRSVRERIVDNLISGLLSETITARSLRWKYGKFLLRFTANDFSDISKTAIIQALQADNPSKELVLVCGVAQITQTLPRLAEFLFDEVAYSKEPNKKHFPKWYFTLGWRARLARARMGVQEDIEKCLAMVDTVTDVHTKATILFHDVAYIRRPEAMEYLRKNFLSDARLSPTNPGMLGEPVSKYLMSILADCLINFPIKKKEARNYTEQEIDLCRKWIAEQTKWDIIR